MEPDTENDPKYDTDKAKLFLAYFSSVFTIEPNQSDMHPFDKWNYETVINDMDITEEQMPKNKLKKLKVNKSPGPDSVHPRVKMN